MDPDAVKSTLSNLDPELEKLHADRFAALKREVEKREALNRQGHVTRSEKVICHLYHKEFYRCKMLDKHLETLAPRHVDTRFIKVDAEKYVYFIILSKGIAIDRLLGFQDLGTKDDFSTTKLENVLVKKGMLSKKKKEEDEEDAE
ncbi:hypothetical protein N665_1909s0003 [Sinapis alba]|nr:hypothetical protein N665_1909s0003 [Sinapis alba]